MEIEVNLQDAKDYTPLPSGSYEVELPEDENCVVFHEAASGTPCVKWNFLVSGTNGQEEFKGRKLTRITPIAG